MFNMLNVFLKVVLVSSTGKEDKKIFKKFMQDIKRLKYIYSGML